MSTYYYKNMADYRSITVQIEEQSQIKKNFVPPRQKFSSILKLRYESLDIPKLRQCIATSFREYGWWGTVSHFSGKDVRSNYYGGLSLTYNPNLVLQVPEVASSFGQPRFFLGDFFSEVDKKTSTTFWKELVEKNIHCDFFLLADREGFEAVKDFLKQHSISNLEKFNWDGEPVESASYPSYKDTYHDSFGFRLRTEPSYQPALDSLFSTCKRSIARSRVASIRASLPVETIADFMWHRDEEICTVLRINIPITTSDNFVLEIENENPAYLNEGYLYTWDSKRMHRVYAKKQDYSERVHLVLGIVPWFDYDSESDSWSKNEFFGEMHPFDMLVNGHVFEGVELCEE